jgi:hypothetical protein
MVPQTYRPHVFMKWFSLAFNILGFIAPPFLIVRFAVRTSQANETISGAAWTVVIGTALLTGMILILTANYFCEITLVNKGISIGFLWRRLFVPWEQVIEVKPTPYHFLGSGRSWIVLTQALTPFHRLYGLIYGFSPLPGFVFDQTIDGHRELLSRISEHVSRLRKDV